MKTLVNSKWSGNIYFSNGCKILKTCEQGTALFTGSQACEIQPLFSSQPDVTSIICSEDHKRLFSNHMKLLVKAK